MYTRQLGRSRIEVGAVGFGCWPIGGLILEDGKSVGWGDVNDDEFGPLMREQMAQVEQHLGR